MKDRLGKLHQQLVDSEGFSLVELDNLPHAAVSQPDQDLDGVLQEARRIREEIQRIHSHVSELRDVNHQTLNKTSHSAVAKRDSNAIGAEVKRGAEAVLGRLHTLNALRGEMETQRGGGDPTARIALTQYQCLSNALREAMSSYSEAELSHREACRLQIHRQMEVVGREVSEEELGEMMDSGEWNVFRDQTEGRTARSAFLQIERRHRELLELERRIQGIQELFMDVALLTAEQGAGMENIQKNVQNTEVEVQEAVHQLDKAITADKNNIFKKLFCSCLPCFYN